MGGTRTLDYKELFEALPVPALLVDEDHRIVTANAAFSERFCSDVVRLAGGSCPMIVHGQADPVPACPLPRAIESGRPAVDELYDRQSDCWLESAVVPTGQRSPEGRRLFLHTIRDVTAEKRLLQYENARSDRLAELAAQREQDLEDAEAVRDDFLAVMSHELRTPLNSIIGFSGMLGAGLAGPITDEQQRQLGMIRSSGEHLLTLVDNILFLDARSSGEFLLAPETFDLRVVPDIVCAELQPVAMQKLLALECEHGSEPVIVGQDRARIRQVVRNLTSNAIKFTERGAVTITCEADGDDAVVRVMDTGCGIPTDDLDRVFDRYYKSPVCGNRPTEGAGLGLYVAQLITRALGGSIAASSVVGLGSAFELRVPRLLEPHRLEP